MDWGLTLGLVPCLAIFVPRCSRKTCCSFGINVVWACNKVSIGGGDVQES